MSKRSQGTHSLVAVFCTALIAVACQSSSREGHKDSSASGGAGGGAATTGSAGSSGTGGGGLASAGGAPAAGGATIVGSGGLTGLGGASSTGGVSGTAGSSSGGAFGGGGVSGTAGAAASGGTGVAGAGGGVANSGGAPGTGGAAATAGVSGAGGATAAGGAIGAGGAMGAGGAADCGDLIDDMEGGTGYICQGSGRVGYWFAYVDTSGASLITPPTTEKPTRPVTVTPARLTSTRAMHLSGTFTSYAGIGCLLDAPVRDAPWTAFDATAYVGVRFYAKGTGGLTFTGQIPATVARQNLGTCTAAACIGAISAVYPLSADWTLISVPFSSLVNGTAPFDPSMLAAIEFQPAIAGQPFDLWIDDISFYK